MAEAVADAAYGAKLCNGALSIILIGICISGAARSPSRRWSGRSFRLCGSSRGFA